MLATTSETAAKHFLVELHIAPAVLIDSYPTLAQVTMAYAQYAKKLTNQIEAKAAEPGRHAKQKVKNSPKNMRELVEALREVAHRLLRLNGEITQTPDMAMQTRYFADLREITNHRTSSDVNDPVVVEMINHLPKATLRPFVKAAYLGVSE